MTEDTRKIRRREDKGNIKCRFMLSGIKKRWHKNGWQQKELQMKRS